MKKIKYFAFFLGLQLAGTTAMAKIPPGQGKTARSNNLGISKKSQGKKEREIEELFKQSQNPLTNKNLRGFRMTAANGINTTVLVRSKDGFQTGEVRVYRANPDGQSSQFKFPLPPQEGKFDPNKLSVVVNGGRQEGSLGIDSIWISRPLKNSNEAHNHKVEIGLNNNSPVVRPLSSDRINLSSGQQTGVRIELSKGQVGTNGGLDQSLLVTLPTTNRFQEASQVTIPISDAKGAPIRVINWKTSTDGDITKIHLTVSKDGQYYPYTYSVSTPRSDAGKPVVVKAEASKGKKALNTAEANVVLKEIGADIKMYRAESKGHESPNGLNIQGAGGKSTEAATGAN